MRIQLYNLFEKDVGYDSETGLWNKVPILFTTEDLDENSIPANYIQLRYDVADNTKTFGDGVTQLRQSDCDIMILTAGAFEDKLDELDEAVAELLNKNEIPFIKINLGYDANLKKTQITYSVVLYG